jgi:hypothetical protein
MGIKPALGWLALLLFTTTAQAEGARDLLTKGSALTKGNNNNNKAPAAIVSVLPKTKAPPPPTLANASANSGSNNNNNTAGLTVVESTGRPRTDYEAEIYSGVPLDGSIAKERGFDKGLVTMVFERQKKGAFRVGKEHIRRVVRLAPEERSLVVTTTGASAAKARPKDHVDVLEMEEGMVIVVDTTNQSSGMFTTSDVYVFTKAATLDQRIGALETLVTTAPMTKTRLREALVAAEWAPIKSADR